LEEIEAEPFDKPKDDFPYDLTRYKPKPPGDLQDRQLSPSIMPTDADRKSDAYSYESGSRANLKSLTDGYIALSTHRLNRVMPILTVIFVPLTFVAVI
jgi:hypothetical protein